MTTIAPRPIAERTARRSRLQRRWREQRWNTVNVGMLERWISGIGGGALTAYGLSRRGWPGLLSSIVGGMLIYRGLTGHCYMYQALGKNTASDEQREHGSVPHNQGIKIEKVVTIEKPAAELYRFWRQLENLPRFMKHLKSVTVRDAVHSRWIAKAPAGTEVAWDAEIINDEENTALAWRSLPGSQIGNAGSVHFTPAPGGRGTEVRVVLAYDPPAGRVGALIARLFGEEPEQQVQDDLRRFKELMETGEAPTVQGQPTGRGR